MFDLPIIDLSKFKVVYGEMVFNAIALFRFEFNDNDGNSNPPKFKFIDVLVVNSDGNLEIISDEAWRFQFIPIVTSQGGAYR